MDKLTLACYSQQNYATRFLNIARNQILNKTDVVATTFAPAADTRDETCCQVHVFSTNLPRTKRNKKKTHQVDHKMRGPPSRDR